MKENDNHENDGNQTPKFINRNVSFDLSLINNSNLNNNMNVSEIDLFSVKSDFQYAMPYKNEVQNPNDGRVNQENNINIQPLAQPNSKPPDLNYIFDFKDDCNITITNNNSGFKPSLAFYRTTFENYIRDTEIFLMNKYKNDRNKLNNIPFKVHKLKVKMILKLINEIFVDDKEVFYRHRFCRDFNDKIVKKKICYVVKFSIPSGDYEYFENLVQNRYDINVSDNDGEDQNLINKDIASGYMNTLEKLQNNLFEGSTENIESNEYVKILEETFADVGHHNSKLYRVFREVLLNLHLSFIVFIKCFCIFLQFSENLYTKLKIIGKELHIEIFCDDEIYLKKADEMGYNFEISEYGKNKLLYSNSKTKTLILNSNNQSDNNDQVQYDQIIKEYTKDIYIPYSPNSLNLFILYDTTNDTQIKEKFNVIYDSSKMSILRNVDRIRILYWSIDNCINFKKLKECDFFRGVSTRRDIKIYPKKSSNYVWSNFNIFNERQIFKVIKKIRNTYGEMASFYFFWTFHILKWTLYFYIFTFFLYLLIQFEFSDFIHFTGVSLKNIINYSFTIIFVLWLNIYIRSWKANEKVYAVKWGVSDFTNTNCLEKDREEYESGDSIEIFSSRIVKESVFRKSLSYFTSFIITFAMIIFTITSLMFLQEIQMPSEEKKSELDELFSTITKKDKKDGLDNRMIPFLIGIYIKILSIIFDYTCIKLTDGENHQKESTYKRSYLLKTIIFNMVNNYFTFYYIIFIKAYKENCPGKDCSKYLSSQLRDIYTSYFIAALMEMVIPLISNTYLRYKMKKTIQSNYPQATPEQLKRIKNSIVRKYGYILFNSYKSSDMVKEYIDVIIIFGYITQFAIIDPFLLIIFCIYIYIQRLIDASKICHFFNVDVFAPINGIGIFNKLLRLLMMLSTFTNLYIIFFIKGIDHKILNKVDHWYAFVILQNFFLILIFFMDLDMLPSWMQNYKQIREDFIKAKNKYVKSKVNFKVPGNSHQAMNIFMGNNNNNKENNNQNINAGGNNLIIEIPNNNQEVNIALNIKETNSARSKDDKIMDV